MRSAIEHPQCPRAPALPPRPLFSRTSNHLSGSLIKVSPEEQDPLADIQALLSTYLSRPGPIIAGEARRALLQLLAMATTGPPSSWSLAAVKASLPESGPHLNDALLQVMARRGRGPELEGIAEDSH